MRLKLLIFILSAVSIAFAAENSSNGYELNISYNPLKSGIILETTKMPTMPGISFSSLSALQINDYMSKGYLASLSNKELFTEPEIFIYADRSVASRARSFTKIDLTEKTYPPTPKNSSITMEKQAVVPDYSIRISELWYSFRGDDFGEHFAVACKLWGGAGIGMMAVLMSMPRSVTKWQGDYVHDAMSNLERAYTNPPVWDQDHWQLNYVGHPYAGAMYYNTIRAQVGSPFQSVVFSAFVSTVWEYVIEATAEQPSVQDLFVTPFVGSAIGELSHQATLHMRKNGFNVFEKVAVTIINPMYIIINGYH